MAVSSHDENRAPDLPSGLDLLGFPPPPPLTRQTVVSRDELLPSTAPFNAIEPVVNGEEEQFVPLIHGVVGYDIWDVLEGAVPEDELAAMGWEGYVTEHEEFPDDSDDDSDDDDNAPSFPPPAA